MPLPLVPTLWTIIPVESDPAWFCEHLTFSLYKLSCLPSDVEDLQNPLFPSAAEAIASISSFASNPDTLYLLHPTSPHLPYTPHSAQCLSALREWSLRYRTSLSAAFSEASQSSYFNPETDEQEFSLRNWTGKDYKENVHRFSLPIVHTHVPIVTSTDPTIISKHFFGETCILSPSVAKDSLPWRTLDKTALGFPILSAKMPQVKAKKAAHTRTSNIAHELSLRVIPTSYLQPLIAAFNTDFHPPIPTHDQKQQEPLNISSPFPSFLNFAGRLPPVVRQIPNFDLSTRPSTEYETNTRTYYFPSHCSSLRTTCTVTRKGTGRRYYRTRNVSVDKPTRFEAMEFSLNQINSVSSVLHDACAYLSLSIRPPGSPLPTPWNHEALRLVRSPFWAPFRTRLSLAISHLASCPSSHLLNFYPLPRKDWVSDDLSHSFFITLNRFRSALRLLTHNLSLPFPFPPLTSTVPDHLRPHFQPLHSLIFLPTTPFNSSGSPPQYYNEEMLRSSNMHWSYNLLASEHLKLLRLEWESKQHLFSLVSPPPPVPSPEPEPSQS